jgi:ADP-heptose:LPS heptosyltransferase
MMTTPVIRTLSRDFPVSRIDVMVGPSGKEIFERDPRIFKLILYDKHMPISQKRRLQLKLKNLRYDLVVDIRNTIFPMLIGPKFRTSTVHSFPKGIVHRSHRHLHRLTSLGISDFDRNYYIHIPKEDEDNARSLLEGCGITDPIVVVNPGAKSHLKRWTQEGFAALCDRLISECSAQLIFIGSNSDERIVGEIIRRMKNVPHNLSGKTSLRVLASILRRSRLLVTNDSAPMHIGCAVGAKVLALFGPTDPRKYGPIGEFDIVISEKLHCAPCESATCAYNYECMRLIPPDTVFDAAKMMIEGYE